MPNASSIRSLPLSGLGAALDKHFAHHGCQVQDEHGELTLISPAEQLRTVALTLRDHTAFRFEQLIDLCGVDYSLHGHSEWETEDASYTGFGRGVDRDLEVAVEDPHRFAVVVHLLSITNNWRLRVRSYVGGEQPIVDSLVSVWSAANWFEREAFDLFGILFRGHPDLRRILTDYGFVGFPFRKDFPLSGQVEMRYDPELRRVVYQPVSIEPRVLVPRVIRQDSRYVKTENAGTATDA